MPRGKLQRCVKSEDTIFLIKLLTCKKVHLSLKKKKRSSVAESYFLGGILEAQPWSSSQKRRAGSDAGEPGASLAPAFPTAHRQVICMGARVVFLQLTFNHLPPFSETLQMFPLALRIKLFFVFIYVKLEHKAVHDPGSLPKQPAFSSPPPSSEGPFSYPPLPTVVPQHDNACSQPPRAHRGPGLGSCPCFRPQLRTWHTWERLQTPCLD